MIRVSLEKLSLRGLSFFVESAVPFCVSLRNMV